MQRAAYHHELGSQLSVPCLSQGKGREDGGPMSVMLLFNWLSECCYFKMSAMSDSE